MRVTYELVAMAKGRGPSLDNACEREAGRASLRPARGAGKPSTLGIQATMEA
jgi:hypothetical protein